MIELALLKRDGAQRIYRSFFEGGRNETAINSCVGNYGPYDDRNFVWQSNLYS